MNKVTLITVFFNLFFFLNLQAQIPEVAEDISPLLIGESIPNLNLENTEGESVSFYSQIKEKNTVLVFYRGGWCPYCNQHLAELGEIEKEILDLGYKILAISPDAVTGLEATGAKNEIKYQLLSDADGEFSKAIGIAFKAPERYEKRLFRVSDGKNNGFLPVPSVFVLNTSGEILFEYVNPNYKKRMSGNMLLSVLEVLKEEN